MKRIDGSRRLLLIAAALFLVVIVAIDLWSRRAAAPATGSAVPLTADGGLATDPALSPDARLLAYASDRAASGNLDIWVRQFPKGEPRRLTSWPEDDSEPAFSPDGKQLAFHSGHGDGGIYVIPASGGEPILLAPKGRYPRFSPDGKWLAFCNDDGQLRLMPASGGDARTLAPQLNKGRYPLWSRDGRHLLFYAHGERRTDWWVLSPEDTPPVATGAFTILRTQGLTGNLDPADWSAEGVLFAGRFRDVPSVWQAPISSTFQCTGPARHVSETPAAKVAASPDGKLVVAGAASRPRIWSLEKDGRLESIDTESAPSGRLAVSHDASTLLYWTADDVRAKDLATGKERKLGEVEGGALLDGSRLVYRAEGSIRAVPLAGGSTPKTLCERCGDPWSLSADGTRLLYQAGWRRGVGLLYTATGEKRELLRREEDERVIFSARFSPDTRWLLIETTRPHDPRQIVLVPFRDGASPQPKDWLTLTDGTNEDRSPVWSPDGSQIYFISDRDGYRCLWSTKPKGKPVPLHHLHQSRRSLAQASLAPAKDKLFFILNETTGELARLR